MSILSARLGCWGSCAFSRSNSLMSTREMHVLGSQDEQDPPTITDILRIILFTELKSRLVMTDDQMEKYWNTWQDMGAWLWTKIRGEAVSTSVWLETVTLVVSQRRDLHAGVTLVHPQSFQDGLRALPCHSPHTHSAWIQSNPASHSACAIIDYRLTASYPALQLLSAMREGSCNTMSRNSEEQHVFVTLSNTNSFNPAWRSLPWGFIFVQQQAPSQLAEEMTWLFCSQQRSLRAA